jgi:hypothetical protein
MLNCKGFIDLKPIHMINLLGSIETGSVGTKWGTSGCGCGGCCGQTSETKHVLKEIQLLSYSDKTQSNP